MTVLMAALLVQQPTAEELFRKMEEKYASAKTLQVKAKIAGTSTAAGKEQKSDFDAEAAFKEGNRIFVRLDGNEAGKGRTLSVTGDGARLRIDFGRGAQTVEMPKDAGATFRRTLARGDWMLMAMLGGLATQGSVEAEVEASDFKYGAEEKVGDRAAKVVEYALVVKAGPQKLTLQQKVWIDAERLTILKREAKNDTTTMTESWSQSAFEGEVKDETFEIPK